MKRVLALVVAIAMVAGSWLIRSRIDDNEKTRSTTLRLVCTEELAAVCDDARASDAARVQTTVEPAGTTADRLSSAPAPAVDAWVAPDPWPTIVDERRQRAQLDPLFGSRRTQLAHSPLALVLWKDAAAVCKDWKCVGEKAGRTLKPGHADPTRDGIGLLVLGQAAVSYFGRPPSDLSAIDLEDPGFDAWFTRLEQAVPQQFTDDPLARMLTIGPSAFDAVGVTEAAASTVRRAARGKDVDVLYPAPMAFADAVVAAVAGARGAQLRSIVEQRGPGALGAAGWRTAGPHASGLPSAGFLVALSERWREVVG